MHGEDEVLWSNKGVRTSLVPMGVGQGCENFFGQTSLYCGLSVLMQPRCWTWRTENRDAMTPLQWRRTAVWSKLLPGTLRRSVSSFRTGVDQLPNAQLGIGGNPWPILPHRARCNGSAVLQPTPLNCSSEGGIGVWELLRSNNLFPPFHRRRKLCRSPDAFGLRDRSIAGGPDSSVVM